MSSPYITSAERPDNVKVFVLDDGRKVRYRNDAELRLIKKAQSVQAALRKTGRETKRRRGASSGGF